MSGEKKSSRLPAVICVVLCAVLAIAILALGLASQDPKAAPKADELVDGVDEMIVPGARYKARIESAGQVVRYGFTPRYGGYYLIRSEAPDMNPRVILRKAGESGILAEDIGSGEEDGFRLRYYLDDGTTYCYEVSLPEDETGNFTVAFEHVN